MFVPRVGASDTPWLMRGWGDDGGDKTDRGYTVLLGQGNPFGPHRDGGRPGRRRRGSVLHAPTTPGGVLGRHDDQGR